MPWLGRQSHQSHVASGANSADAGACGITGDSSARGGSCSGDRGPEVGRMKVDIRMARLHRFLFWIFAHFVNPLLSTCFYITEGEGTGSEVLFYRRPVWSQIMRLGKKQMESNFVEVKMGGSVSPELKAQSSTILPMSPTAADTQAVTPSNTILPVNSSSDQLRRRGDPLIHFPLVRFVPKKTTVRAITNLRTRASNLSISKSSNDLVVNNASLYNSLQVLKKTYSENPSLAGFGSMGLDDIYVKIKSFKQRLAQKLGMGTGAVSSSYPPLFVAALDLEKCYDNIDTGRLFDLLSTILSSRKRQHSAGGSNDDGTCSDEDEDEEEDSLIVHRYTVSHRIKSMDRTVSRTIRFVTEAGDLVPFRGAYDDVHYLSFFRS